MQSGQTFDSNQSTPSKTDLKSIKYQPESNTNKHKIPSICFCCFCNFCIAIAGTILLVLNEPKKDFSSWEPAKCTLQSVDSYTTETSFDPFGVLNTEDQNIPTSWGLGIYAIVAVDTNETNRSYVSAGNNCGVFTYVDGCNCTNRNSTSCYGTRSALIDWTDCGADPWCDISMVVAGPCEEKDGFNCQAPQLEHGKETGKTMNACSNHEGRVSDLLATQLSLEIPPIFPCWAAPDNSVPGWLTRIPVFDHRALYDLRGQWVGVRFTHPNRECQLDYQDINLYYGMISVGGVIFVGLCCAILLIIGIIRLPSCSCCFCCSCCCCQLNRKKKPKVRNQFLSNSCSKQPKWKKKLDDLRRPYVVEKENATERQKWWETDHSTGDEWETDRSTGDEWETDDNDSKSQLDVLSDGDRKKRKRRKKNYNMTTSTAIVWTLMENKRCMKKEAILAKADFEEAVAKSKSLSEITMREPVCDTKHVEDELHRLYYKLSIGNLTSLEREDVMKEIEAVKSAPKDYALLNAHQERINQAYARKHVLYNAIEEIQAAIKRFEICANIEARYNNEMTIVPGDLEVKIIDVPSSSILNKIIGVRGDGKERLRTQHCIEFESIHNGEAYQIKLIGLPEDNATATEAIHSVLNVEKRRELVRKERRRKKKKEENRKKKMVREVTLASYYDHRRPPLQ
jgi:hypothetical protein